MSLNGFVFGVVTVQLVPLLEAAGLTAAAAVWIASLKGFAQFGGRVVEISFGSRLRAITVARLAIGALPLSFLLLLFAGANVQVILAFTLLMATRRRDQHRVGRCRSSAPTLRKARLHRHAHHVVAVSLSLFALVWTAAGWRRRARLRVGLLGDGNDVALV
jgi:hypothetical protein